MENLNKLINPHKNSVIPDNLDLELSEKKSGIEILKDKNSGERYFRKNDKWGQYTLEKEHFISLLIKGIFHSSEIVKIDNSFLSREMELENTEKGLPLEKEAEVFVLRNVLGDFDKGLGDHNTIKNENDQFSHYDFDCGFEEVCTEPSIAERLFNDFCSFNKFSNEDIYNFSLQILSKLNMLEIAVNDKDFISAILRKTNFKPLDSLEKIYPPNKTFKKLFNAIERNKNTEDLNFLRVRKILIKPIKIMKNVAKKEIEKFKNLNQFL